MFEGLTNSLGQMLHSALERAGRMGGSTRHVSREVDTSHLFEKNPFDVLYRNVRDVTPQWGQTPQPRQQEPSTGFLGSLLSSFRQPTVRHAQPDQARQHASGHPPLQPPPLPQRGSAPPAKPAESPWSFLGSIMPKWRTPPQQQSPVEQTRRQAIYRVTHPEPENIQPTRAEGQQSTQQQTPVPLAPKPSWWQLRGQQVANPTAPMVPVQAVNQPTQRESGFESAVAGLGLVATGLSAVGRGLSSAMQAKLGEAGATNQPAQAAATQTAPSPMQSFWQSLTRRPAEARTATQPRQETSAQQSTREAGQQRPSTAGEAAFRSGLSGLQQIGSNLSGVLRSAGSAVGRGGAAGVAGMAARGLVSGAIGRGIGAATGSAVAGGAAGLAAAAGGAIALPLGLLTGATALVRATVSRNRQNIADMAPLAGLSGGMQSAFLGMAGADYRRQQVRSNFLASSTGEAIRQQNEFNDTSARFGMRWSRLKNEAASGFMGAVVNPLFSKTEAFLQNIGVIDKLKVNPYFKPDALTDTLAKIGMGNWGGKKFKNLPDKNDKGRAGF